MAKIKNYTEAIQELQAILDELKADEVAVDQLAKKVKRANELMEYCQGILRNTAQAIEE